MKPSRENVYKVDLHNLSEINDKRVSITEINMIADMLISLWLKIEMHNNDDYIL